MADGVSWRPPGLRDGVAAAAEALGVGAADLSWPVREGPELIGRRARHRDGELAVVRGIAAVHEAGERGLWEEHEPGPVPGRRVRPSLDLGPVGLHARG